MCFEVAGLGAMDVSFLVSSTQSALDPRALMVSVAS